MFSDLDLHTHSTASDGRLSPGELVALADQAGVRRLALTDHDTVAGLAEAERAAAEHEMTLIPGVEISAQWSRQEIHVVGLWIDPRHPALEQALAEQAERRNHRAERIARKLAQRGIDGALAGAQALADGGSVTRAHFARWLVDAGHVKDFPQAFRRYLGKGKPAAVGMDWPELDTVVGWIRAAGGLAVLAHPLKYRLTATRLRALLADFSAMGGLGMEVRSGGEDAERLRHCLARAEDYELLASMGSDFHAPTDWQPSPGRLPVLPEGTRTVWDYAARELPRAG
ncbi:putative metal-dependent phosphoesterase TrpH [Natronospira proteinivora]|uniref:Metal-dependent phosphoesterase TrpH n=1 Tax=Natronospira proteinivora TaxID=1807133 RepID=A0ABT1GC19_9GAMM|nr:PHP domain-containing protein [Natronospira proteinivora]MCP1728592.1 putative metal-dependent phosphoesterase TrpH [Natronospira proteinivora]